MWLKYWIQTFLFKSPKNHLKIGKYRISPYRKPLINNMCVFFTKLQNTYLSNYLSWIQIYIKIITPTKLCILYLEIHILLTLEILQDQPLCKILSKPFKMMRADKMQSQSLIKQCRVRSVKNKALYNLRCTIHAA